MTRRRRSWRRGIAFRLREASGQTKMTKEDETSGKVGPADAGEVALRNWVRGSKGTWRYLTMGAVWAVGLLSGFVLPPPADDLRDGNLRLAQFVATFVIGLMFYPVAQYAARRHARAWILTTIVLLALGLGSLFTYWRHFLAWTYVYDGQRRVIGSVLTPEAEADRVRLEKQLRRPVPAVELPRHSGEGGPKACWPPEEIDSRTIWLGATYVGTICAWVAAVIGLLQVVHVAPRPKSGTGRRGGG